MTRLRSERGFTLPELLTTMAIAMIIVLATFTLVEIVMKRSGDVGSRVETTAGARTAMDQITRQLRSQVCAKPSLSAAPRSLAAASPKSVSVYTDFTNEPLTNGQLPAPDLRTITLDGTAKIFTETVTKGSRTSANIVIYPPTPTATRPFLTNVVPLSYSGAGTTKPIVFRYYRFPTPTDGSTILPPGSTADVEVVGAGTDGALTEDQLTSVAMITVEFKVLSKTGGESGSTTLKNQVYVRTADPNAQIPKPTCLTY